MGKGKSSSSKKSSGLPKTAKARDVMLASARSKRSSSKSSQLGPVLDANEYGPKEAEEDSFDAESPMGHQSKNSASDLESSSGPISGDKDTEPIIMISVEPTASQSSGGNNGERNSSPGSLLEEFVENTPCRKLPTQGKEATTDANENSREEIVEETPAHELEVERTTEEQKGQGSVEGNAELGKTPLASGNEIFPRNTTCESGGTANAAQDNKEGRNWSDLFKRSYANDLAMEYIPPVAIETQGEVVYKMDRDIESEGLEKWKHSLIGHFLGDPPPFHVVKNMTSRYWGKFGSFHTASLDKGFFLFAFNNEQVCAHLLSRVWHVWNVPLILRKWHPDMEIDNLEHNTCYVWTTIHNIPIRMWSRRGIAAIASLCGRPVAIDPITKTSERMGFARVLLELEKDKERKTEACIETSNGRRFMIRFVYLDGPICSKCKEKGHVASQCNRFQHVAGTSGKNTGVGTRGPEVPVRERPLSKGRFKSGSRGRSRHRRQRQEQEWRVKKKVETVDKLVPVNTVNTEKQSQNVLMDNSQRDKKQAGIRNNKRSRSCGRAREVGEPDDQGRMSALPSSKMDDDGKDKGKEIIVDSTPAVASMPAATLENGDKLPEVSEWPPEVLNMVSKWFKAASIQPTIKRKEMGETSERRHATEQLGGDRKTVEDAMGEDQAPLSGQ